VSSTSTEDFKQKKPCRFGIHCRNQPTCKFDHTPPNDRISTSRVSEFMKQIAHELDVNIIKYLFVFLLKRIVCAFEG
jgi:hypothetical protein